MKRIVKWLSIAVLSLFILIVFSIVVFQSKIETAALSQLDQLTNHQLSYTRADINYINSFPSITLDLSEPKLYDLDYNEAIQLEEFQVKLNLFKSVFSNPTISRLVVKNGSVTLRERNQKWNVVDLMTSESSTPTQTKLITIDELIVENFNIIVDRGTADQIVQLSLPSAEMRMTHQQNELKIEAQGLVRFDYLINAGDAQLVELHDSFQALLAYNTDTKRLEISNTHLDHGLTADGWFNANNSQRDIQLKIENLDTRIFNKWMANNAKSESEAIQLKGDVSGIVSMDGVEDINYSFYLQEFGILHPLIELTDINSTMTGDQTAFTVQKFDVDVDGENISGLLNYHIQQNKIIKLALDGTVPLKPIYRLTGNTQFKDIDGGFKINDFSLSNYIVDSKDQNITDFIDASVLSEDIRLQTNDDRELSIGTGDLRLKNGEFIFDNLVFQFDKSDLIVNAKYASKERQFLQLTAQSTFLNLDDLMQFVENDTSASTVNVLDANRLFIDIEAKTAVLNEVEVSDVNLKLNSIENTIDIDASGNAFSGTIDAQGKLAHNGEHYHLHLNIDAAGIDLEDCMKQNKNFGQEIVTHQNLKGDLHTLCSFNLFYDDDWNFQETRTKGLIGGTILNGQLKDVELMSQFSKFVKIKDLNNIQFTELNNYLEIQGKNLYIPTMFIQSNAANFTLSGYHSTENIQLYYLKLNAGQILSNKFKKHDPSYSPKPAKQNGWFNMHYVISGTGEEYTYKRDRSRVKAAFENGNDRKNRIYHQLLREFGFVDELASRDIEE